jgi:periplasmic mercuric ion binding protein
MLKSLAVTLLGTGLLVSPAAFGAEKTVTLAVQNMYCAACPLTVKGSLEAVPGVSRVTVSYTDKTAIVTFDDTETTVPALIAATTNAGYPSSPRS